MYNSDVAIYSKRVSLYEDMSNFATLAMFILNALGAEIENIEQLIGAFPTMQVKRSLNEEDLKLIEFAKENKIKYEITENGIRLGN